MLEGFVRGGQGRSDDEVVQSALIAGVCFLAGLLILLGAAVGGLLS